VEALYGLNMISELAASRSPPRASTCLLVYEVICLILKTVKDPGFTIVVTTQAQPEKALSTPPSTISTGRVTTKLIQISILGEQIISSQSGIVVFFHWLQWKEMKK
jgi:hypothetical protein